MTVTANPDTEISAALHDGMPFAAHLEIEARHADTEYVVTSAHWQPEYCGIGGVLHGGYLMALADSTGATLAYLNLPAGHSTTTVESKTNFFRPVVAGPFTATATMVHKGRTTMVVQTDVTNEGGSRVCRTVQTQIVRPAAD